MGSLDQPDIYESSRPVFDFQVSKKFANNKAELRLNIQDILNRTLYFYQNPDGNARLDKANENTERQLCVKSRVTRKLK